MTPLPIILAMLLPLAHSLAPLTVPRKLAAAASSPLLTGLVSAWELDEASGDAIDSHGSNTLTETGGTIGAGGSGGRDFEAADTEWFEHADNADLSTGDIDFTFEVWVDAESLGTYPVILRKGLAGAATREFALYFDTDANRFAWGVVTAGGDTVSAFWSSAPSVGVPYQLICWHDSVNNQVGIAVNNGTPVTVAHSGGVRDGAGSFQLGASDDQGLYWDGILRRCRFWKRVLTSAERTQLYNSGAGLAYPFS